MFSPRKYSASKICFFRLLNSNTPTTACQWNQYTYNNLSVFRSVTSTVRAGGSPQPPQRRAPWLCCPRPLPNSRDRGQDTQPLTRQHSSRDRQPQLRGPRASHASCARRPAGAVSFSIVAPWTSPDCEISLLKQMQQQPVPRTIIYITAGP